MEYNHKTFGKGVLVREETVAHKEQVPSHTFNAETGKLTSSEWVEKNTQEHYLYLQFEDNTVRCFTPKTLKAHLI